MLLCRTATLRTRLITTCPQMKPTANNCWPVQSPCQVAWLYSAHIPYVACLLVVSSDCQRTTALIHWGTQSPRKLTKIKFIGVGEYLQITTAVLAVKTFVFQGLIFHTIGMHGYGYNRPIKISKVKSVVAGCDTDPKKLRSKFLSTAGLLRWDPRLRMDEMKRREREGRKKEKMERREQRESGGL